MIRRITRSLLNLIMLTALTTASLAQQAYVYNFKNTLNEVSGTGPALNVLGTGAFVNEGLDELSCVSRPVYGFTQNSGIQFDNGAANDFIGSAYSIEMYFQFLNNSGYMRIIDFKNQTSDSGLYSTANLLLFYDEITINTTSFVANQYVHLVVTRESATDLISLYVDGVLAGSFIDNTGKGLLDTSNVLNFFVDDLVSGGEARPGRIALLKIYDAPLDSAAVANNFNGLQTESGTLAFTSDISAACLNNNVFNFTNTSDNAGGYTYSWDFGDGNSFIGNNASHTYSTAGIYNVLLIADNGTGCIDTVSTAVEVYSAAPVNLGPDAAICAGDSITLDAGTGFATYLWNTGSADQSIVVSVSGTYSIQVTDSIGCTGFDTVIVDVFTYPLLDLGPDAFLCFGETMTLNATPGQASYLWSTGDTTASIIVGVSGVYAVEIANTGGCSVSDTLVLTVNPEIIMTLGADTAFCDGNVLTLDPGAGFQAFAWSDGSVLPTLDVTTSGTYAVTVTDLFGCTTSDTIDVMVNALPVPDLGADSTFCGGTPVVLDPGASFAGYLWNDGSQNPTLVTSAGGTYSVVVSDINGCSGNDSVVLTATPIVSLGSDQNWCTGLTTTLDAGAGMASYLWNDGSVSQTLDVTVSGTYTVTVSDNNGCVNQDDVTVTFQNVPVIELGPDFDICDGQIAILNPGTGYPDYLWSDGSTDSILYVTAAGTYSVTVSSAANCEASDSITIGVLPLPVLEMGADTAVCDGTTLTLDAGVGFTAYLWSDGSSNQTLDVTQTGIYAVTITGSNGCENTDSLLVTFEGPPFLELGPDQSICSGTATVLDAGSGMAAYLWNDGSTSQLLLAFANGTYSVTITSFAGCVSQDSVTITLLSSPVVTLGADTTVCDGTQLVLDAGAGFNSYVWSDGTFAQTITVTAAGNYTVVVTDANNCNGTDDIEVLYYAPVPVPVITQNVNTLSSSAATGNQWYSVPGGLIAGETGQTFSPGQNGTYYVVVTDSNGCESVPSADFIFVLDGLQTYGDYHVSLVPNPASNQVTIATGGLPGNSFRLEVLDILGKTIYLDETIPAGSYNMDVSAFLEGVYFVRISSGTNQAIQRLVIAR